MVVIKGRLFDRGRSLETASQTIEGSGRRSALQLSIPGGRASLQGIERYEVRRRDIVYMWA